MSLTLAFKVVGVGDTGATTPTEVDDDVERVCRRGSSLPATPKLMPAPQTVVDVPVQVYSGLDILAACTCCLAPTSPCLADISSVDAAARAPLPVSEVSLSSRDVALRVREP